MAALALIALATAQDEKLPLDFYIVVDMSASIAFQAADARCRAASGGKSCWALISSFVQTLLSTMAELAGGYQETPGASGLRVGVVSFSCHLRAGIYHPITHWWVAGPEGVSTRVQAGVAQLAKQTPMGSTCPSQAFADIAQNISASQSLDRPSAVVLLTDGNTTPQNLAAAQKAAGDIRAQNSTSMFAIALGASGAAAKGELLNYVGEDPSHLFYASNANALASLEVSVVQRGAAATHPRQAYLSASLLGRFDTRAAPTNAQLDEAAPFRRAGDAPTAVCQGAKARFCFFATLRRR